jgi:PAS domain S-box-containing protein
MISSSPWAMQVRGTRMAASPGAWVLVVDDDPTKRLALMAILAPLDVTIVEADSGLNALRRVSEQDFAAILLDVRMPEMDGFETAALIRRRKESEMTPIIFITAFGSDEIGTSARYVEGAVDFMFAPVPPEELRAKVSVFINLYLQAEGFAAQARDVKVSADQLKLLTDAAPIGIFRTDADYRFVYTNPRWTEISGVTAEEAVGRDWETILGSSESTGALLETSDTSPEAVESRGRRFRLTLPDSTSRVVVVTAEALQDESGQISGWVGTLADVTAEAEAEEVRARFQALVQNSRDVIAVIDPLGRCSYMSPGLTDTTGFSPDEVMGSSWFDFVHPDDLHIVTTHLDDIASTHDPRKTIEVRTRSKEDGWIWIEIRSASRLEDPSIEGIVLNYHDITERRAAAHRLAESEKVLAEGQSLSHLGSFNWNMRTDELTWSDEQYRLLGYEPGSVDPSFDAFLGRIHPDDRAAFSSGTQNSMETGAPFELDMRIDLPDGKLRWIQGKGEVTSEDGVPTRLIGMSHDITARKEAEDERLYLLGQQKELADQLRILLDSTGEGIFGLDRSGVCTFMNKAGAFLLGGTADQFVGHDMHELTHHSHPDGSAYPAEDCPLREGLRTGKAVILAGETLWRLDGTSFPVDYSSHPIGGPGSTEGSVVAFQDVTQRQAMEREVRQSEKLFRGAFDAAQTGIALTLADGFSYVDVNQALCEMLGYSRDELLALDWRQVTHPDDLERNLGEFSQLMMGNDDIGYLTKRYVRKDGETISVEINDSVVRGPDGSALYFVTHINDVTERDKAANEREKLESQLVQAQKMEAVGQLAGGVAHDFNNILSVILNYALFASEDLDADDDRLADIQEISKAGEKAAVLVHQLLAFSRKEIVEERVIDLNEILTGIYQILSRSLGEDIDLDFNGLDGLPSVLADPGRIEQVLLNLAVNARDAMPEGGVLRISTGTESVVGGGLLPLETGDYVVVTVDDTGTGMDKSTLERIFEPFFTTKVRGEGTGMGLSSAYGIIEQAGGCLSVKSEVGVGTTFAIYLPQSDDRPVATPMEDTVDSIGGTETILLVEDEDAVRELVSRILVKQGYDVVPYSSGSEALEYCRTNSTSIDLLLTDVVMPKMSGKELSEEAASICTHLKTLFMSGYTDALIAQRGVLASGENLIAKPFKAEKLLVTVRSLLDASVAA